ncbi:MAG: DUF4167 domain-containing protein [Pseudomonadota bacterium]
MRPAQKQNRARGRGNRKGGNGGNNVNRVYESAGPEGKVRGTPQQIVEKYLSLARDAQTSGDRVTAENFLQHAEHYQRILSAALGAQAERREAAAQDDDDDDDRVAAQGVNGQANGHDSAERDEDSVDAQGGENGGDGRRRGRRGRRSNGENGLDTEGGRSMNGDAGPVGNGHDQNGIDPRDGADPRDAAAIGGFDTIEPEDGLAGPQSLVEDDAPAPRRRRSRRRETGDAAEATASGDGPAEDSAAATGDEA